MALAGFSTPALGVAGTFGVIGEESGTDFGVNHLPYGVFAPHGKAPRVGVRFEDRVLDIGATAREKGEPWAGWFERPSLNTFMAQGRPAWAEVRARLRQWLADRRVSEFLFPLDSVELLMPIEVADYVDFYASEHHATNVGRLFRPGSEPLAPNWRHMPIAYHGRAGTVVVSGSDIPRPSGQHLPAGAGLGSGSAGSRSAGAGAGSVRPVFGPTERLDFEAEVGFVVGGPSARGAAVPLDRAGQHVFGVVLVNDWSARDIQAWEYVPLGPHLSKSFATSISPWITPLAALEDAWCEPPARQIAPVPYLDDAGRRDGLDLDLSVTLNGKEITRPPFKGMYWTYAQMLAHMTVNGASLRVGDLYASGTVSGPDSDQWGSLLELSRGWTTPVPSGAGDRLWLEDGDEVVISAQAAGAGGTIVLGEVAGRVVAGRVVPTDPSPPR